MAVTGWREPCGQVGGNPVNLSDIEPGMSHSGMSCLVVQGLWRGQPAAVGFEVMPESALAGEEASVKELARSILATPTGRVGCFNPNLFRAPAMASGAPAAAAEGPCADG